MLPIAKGARVFYREGSASYLALVTHVRDDGRVNLAVFPTDGGCVARAGIAIGDGPGKCTPIAGETVPSDQLQRALVDLHGELQSLHARLDALTQWATQVTAQLDSLKHVPPAPHDDPTPATPTKAS